MMLLVSHVSANADDGPPCRGYRAKRQGVPIYREADRQSEVLGKLERSEEVCGLAETREFVSILWPRSPEVKAKVEEREASATPTPVTETAPSATPYAHAFVRTVDLWPPRGELDPNRNPLKEWWLMRQNGLVPDDPLGFFRSLLPFFGDSPQNAPSPGGKP